MAVTNNTKKVVSIMSSRTGISASFFFLFAVSLLFFGASLANAGSAHDAAFDERGKPVMDKWGKCVRTKWDGDRDPCAPPAPKPAPAPVQPKPAPRPVVKLEQRQIFFDFDSAELDAEAVDKLTYLARVINNSSAIADVNIIGFADEIGASDYNLALSQRRVKAVEQFLDQRTRIDTQAADIRGLGESKGDEKCDRLPRKQKIACLRTERRVEVEFKYQLRR